jgi:hypothetical protein
LDGLINAQHGHVDSAPTINVQTTSSDTQRRYEGFSKVVNTVYTGAKSDALIPFTIRNPH